VGVSKVPMMIYAEADPRNTDALPKTLRENKGKQNNVMA
jgi:hypothetical protein